MRIAVGTSRKEKVWRNIDITWEEFVERVKNTKRTWETTEQFKSLPKDKRDNIKDVGGFVGGWLKEGKRRKGNVEFRSIITLDVDYAREGFFDDLIMLHDYKCLIYSTHSHALGNERFRLIIPLKKEVTSHEYGIISKAIANDLGVEQFDNTTYEAERLMYWPSTSKDGEFVFEIQEGEMLDPLEILKEENKVEEALIEKDLSEIKNQKDPLEKEGIVGAFCRTYTIEEAIENFLGHVYEKSAGEGRYNYIKAKSAAGVIVYENKFAYSHHSTDKACNILCNAFDLVKIHKFGHLDKEEKSLKSFEAMQRFCMKDEKVKSRFMNEKIEKAKEDFNGEVEDWTHNLEVNKEGKIKGSLQNIILILREDKALKSISYNTHKDCIYARGTLPWKRIKTGWTDSDLANLKVYLDKIYGIWSPIKLKEGLLSVATERSYHPVKEYLEGLEPWDNIKRIDNLLIDYLGAEESEYTKAIIRKTLVAAVGRVYKPGIKFDSVLILNGPQGIGKSTFFEKLGKEWFSDSLTLGDMKDKAAAEKLQGYWILELGELAGIRKADIEAVKSFVTRTDDKYRASYGINVESHLRQSIIVGTTNSEGGFLRDITGNRRFWPAKVRKGKKNPWDLKDVDKIWAEALHLYKKGEDLFLKGNEAQLAVEKQKEAMEEDEREGLVREYLEKLLPKTWEKMSLYERRNYLNGNNLGEKLKGTEKKMAVCSMEIWCECFGKDSASLRKIDSYEITAIMSKIEGWELYSNEKIKILNFPIYNKQRAFMRGEEN